MSLGAVHVHRIAVRAGFDGEGAAGLVAPFTEVGQAAAPGRVGRDADAVVEHRERGRRAVDGQSDIDLRGVGVARGVGKGFAQHGDEVVGDLSGIRVSMARRNAPTG